MMRFPISMCALFAALVAALRSTVGFRYGVWNVAEQFHLAAVAQNLKRFVHALARQAAHSVAGMA